MQKKAGTRGIVGARLRGEYWGLYRPNGKKDGHNRDYKGYVGIMRYFLGKIRGKAKETGNYHIVMGHILGFL